jgi:hypothetical protein
MTALEMKIAAMHGVTGDIAYGTVWTINKVKAIATTVLEAAKGDEEIALAIITAANKWY